jgi:hypothetical protein
MIKFMIDQLSLYYLSKEFSEKIVFGNSELVIELNERQK